MEPTPSAIPPRSVILRGRGYERSVCSCRFAPEISNAEVARRFVESELRRRAVGEEAVFLAQLLTTELVTNAVRHAGSHVDITVARREDRIRIEARDYSTELPRMPESDASTRHRGLLLVDDLSEDWGVEVHDQDGKVVWFEVLASELGPDGQARASSVA